MAKIGNKSAQKWTPAKSLKFMTDSFKLLEESPEIMFIGSLAVRMKKEKNIFNYLVEASDDWDDKTVSGSIKTIKNRMNTIIESRLAENGLAGVTNPALTIFCLKNNFKWQDKTHSEVQSSVISINVDKEDLKV